MSIRQSSIERQIDFPAQFNPVRRTGLIFHTVLFIGFLLSGGGSLLLALQSQQGSEIIQWIIVTVVLLAPTPFVAIRGLSLNQGKYNLDRDGLRIRWGLRGEDIPLPEVEWIRPADELGYKLRLPVFRWPGSLYGKRNTEGLGLVEFIASDTRGLLLIATPEKVYAISPEHSQRFLNAFLYAMELGSLARIRPATTLPTAFLSSILGDRTARWLILLGFVISLILFGLTILAIYNNAVLPLGYDPQGFPSPPGPSEQILLLPILASIVYAVDLLAGMFFFRRRDRLVSYSLWGAGILTSSILCIAVILLA